MGDRRGGLPRLTMLQRRTPRDEGGKRNGGVEAGGRGDGPKGRGQVMRGSISVSGGDECLCYGGVVLLLMSCLREYNLCR